MPHLDIQYTANLEPLADMPGLCTKLAAMLVALQGESGPLFPVAGTRVMAWPAPHFAVADGQADRAFIFMLARIAPGRSNELKKMAGEALLATATEHLLPLLATHAIGLTVEMEEGAPFYIGKHNNLAAHLGRT
jgi:5-carboxymethyl-2-hydroxymuconate isomerase